jgi:hypothetical protein
MTISEILIEYKLREKSLFEGDTTSTAYCTCCNTPLGEFEKILWNVCLSCVKSRRKAIKNNNICACGDKVIPGNGYALGSKSWQPCIRCLGAIKSFG